MAADNKPKYYLVEASVLPEIFAKVIEAKELLETGQVRTVADAVACVDISRSAFYKYKDFVRLSPSSNPNCRVCGPCWGAK